MKKFIIIFFILSISGSAVRGQSLEDYLHEAADKNQGLQAMFKNFETALQKVPQLSALPDPTLSFGYFVSPVETRVGPQRAKFSLTQRFPWFGTLKARGDAAALLAESKYQDFLDAKNKLYYSVTSAYYPLFELNQWKEIEKENIRLLQSYKTIANSRFKNGQGSMVDVLRVDMMLKDAVTNLSILEQKEKPLQTTFNKLLNKDENEPVIIKDSLVIANLSEQYRKDSLLSENPALNSLDLKIQASKANEQASIRQGFPTVGVGLDYVVVGERSDIVMPENGKDVLMPMISMSIPIFRKKYNASVKEARLMQESYAFQKNEYINTLTSGYDIARFDLRQELDLLTLYDQQIEETNQTLHLLFAAYSNSGNDFEEVLRMQQQKLKYEKMKASAEVKYKLAIAKLDYLTAKTF